MQKPPSWSKKFHFFFIKISSRFLLNLLISPSSLFLHWKHQLESDENKLTENMKPNGVTYMNERAEMFEEAEIKLFVNAIRNDIGIVMNPD
jgi:uncharacterized membrane protein